MPYYDIPEADSNGNLICYNSFGGLEEKKVHPYYSPIVYPEHIGKDERHDDEFYESVTNENSKAQGKSKQVLTNHLLRQMIQKKM